MTFQMMIIVSMFFSLIINASESNNIKAHSHGVAKIELAVDQKQLSISFEAPADSILGFEHQPKTQDEKALVENKKNNWKEEYKEIFHADFLSGCKLENSNWELKSHGKSHREIEASVLFSCNTILSGKILKISLIKKYPKVEKLNWEILRTDGSVQKGQEKNQNFSLSL